jgi:hypothetical protein
MDWNQRGQYCTTESVLGEEVGLAYRVSIQLIAYVHPSAIPLE